MMPRGMAVVGMFLLGTRFLAAQPPVPSSGDSCVRCHSDPGVFGQDRLALVQASREDIHQTVGIGCAGCHGGNPDPALAEDMAGAMDPDFAANPYRGVPKRAEIPGFCGRCHSDPVYMKRFKPEVRVDQEKEYWTSRHGIALRRGDPKPATCTDCHHAHGVLAAGDSRSPVYPRRVAETCARCHADPAYMAGYKLPDGQPLPVDQYALWEISVHGRALLEREDLSAPTCNDCHGNHGATPPGLDSLTFVCGQCHGREAELFRASGKRAGFETHNQLLAEMGGAACDSCHEVPEVLRISTSFRGFGECTTCHGNHGIVRPTLAMLAPLPATPCAFCHESPEITLNPPTGRYGGVRDDLLAQGQALGLAGDLLYDWLVGQARSLPEHRVQEGGQRPEFERLWLRFRIGTTRFSYQEPGSGGQMREKSVIRCSTCHVDLSGGSPDRPPLDEFVGRLQTLAAVTAEAERTLLRARRGGVETAGALTELEQAMRAHIELQVLLHGFDSGPDSAFQKRFNEGLDSARRSLEEGRAALRELSVRRTGLVVSLGFITLVLVGLGLKIRSLPD